MSNQDVATTPQADQWANGTDMADELQRMMDVRAAALSRFGEEAIRNGRPMATIEEVLVPLYMHHRYQTESTATAVGGVAYTYAMRGDGLTPMWRVAAAQQNAALDALMRTLDPSELALPAAVLESIPPRPPGYGSSRELFPRYTGSAFDAVTPAVVAASHTVSSLLTPERAARMVQQKMLDPSLPGLDDVLGRLVDAAFEAETTGAYEQQIKTAVEAVVVDGMMRLASDASMLEVRAQATAALKQVHGHMTEHAEVPHAALIAMDIERFLQRPHQPAEAIEGVSAPPGAPIGQPAMSWLDGLGIGQPALDWLARTEAFCTWEVYPGS
jgi:hypothetical protein